jgi:LruC domain-containing protein/uncharacterized repeat protein (TIGR02543 family)
MKLSFKTILPILLIFTLLILLTGCGAITPSPGYTPGTITGIIAAPCCSTSADPVTDPCCIPPEYWCNYCDKEWKLQNNVEVILTYGEDEIATVFTNEDGEYTFTDVEPGKNYVITALCPDYDDDRPLVKDVALEVVEGETFDTKITDCVSTSLGLVVDFLVTYTELGPEEIVLDGVIASQPEFLGFSMFKALVKKVCLVLENCGNLTTDEDVQDALCKAAEEIGRKVLPDLDLGCTPEYAPGGGPGPTPGPTPINPCDVNAAPVISKVEYDDGTGFKEVHDGDTINVIVGQSYTIRVTATDDGIKNPLTYSGTVDGVSFGPNSSNQITVNPSIADEYSVSLSVYDGCAFTPWGSVTVVVDPVTTYVLTMAVNPAEGGIGITNPSVGTHTYDAGTVVPVTATATPVSGYHFVDWTGDVANPNSASTTVIMDADKTITANFSNQYKLTVAVDPSSIQGDVSTVPVVGGPYWYNDGDIVNLKVSSYPEDYIFLRWTADSGNVANPDDPDSAEVTMDQSKVVTAHFVPEEFFDGGNVTVGFEDLPSLAQSDFDYNDFILDIMTNLVKVNIDGVDLLEEIQFDFTPKARGAGLNSSFYLFIPEDTFVLGVENSAQYDLNISGSSYSSGSSGSYDVTADWDKMVIPWAREALPGIGNDTNTLEFLNDNPANPIPYEDTYVTARLTITFDKPIAFDFSSYDPYSLMHGEGLFYVPYLKVYSGSSSPIPGVPQDTINEPNSGIDQRIITVPVDDTWQWPEEGVFICDAYTEVGNTGGIPDVFPLGWWLHPADDGSIYGDGFPRP